MRSTLTKSFAAAGALFAATILPAMAGLQAPDTVDKGDQVEVVVQGETTGTRLELWGPVTQDSTGSLLVSQPLTAAATILPLDQPAGSYELRHISAAGEVLARESIDVAVNPVAFIAPDAVDPSGQIPVTWHGPGLSGDRIQLVDTATGAVIAEELAIDEQGEITLPAPNSDGALEIVYITSGGAVLGTHQIAVGGGTEWIRSPLVVSPGEPFQVEWMGALPGNEAVRIVKENGDPVDNSAALVERIDGKALSTLIAPEKTGDYVIEVFDLASGTVRKTLPLDVDPS